MTQLWQLVDVSQWLVRQQTVLLLTVVIYLNILLF